MIERSAPTRILPLRRHPTRSLLDELDAGNTGNGFRTLADFGVEVHQGLRTGFNPFFYYRPQDTSESAAGAADELIEPEYLLPVIHQQGDLNSLIFGPSDAATRLVSTGLGILASDFRTLSQYPASWIREWQEAGLHELPKGISACVEVAGGHSAAPFRAHPCAGLVGCRTQSSIAFHGPGSTPRPPTFWYRISISGRHRPDLFMPRVINSRVRAFRARDGLIVDANFSTLTCTPQKFPVSTTFALLNSIWGYAASDSLGHRSVGAPLSSKRRICAPFAGRHSRDLKCWL